MSKSVDLWLDLKSPYSFLAKDPAYALERELGVTLRLRPYARTTWPIPRWPNAACVA
jgi:2-hydroxychromene-2-carboxylate isomerase